MAFPEWQSLDFRMQGDPEAVPNFGHISFVSGGIGSEGVSEWEPVKVNRQVFSPPATFARGEDIRALFSPAVGVTWRVDVVDRLGRVASASETVSNTGSPPVNP